ncbi:hypothetical protein HGD90_04060 [Rhodobacteraceae bacterium R_SAG7]|nr:hypothetical protein [Rhodobacteraceae bacterium R_SAG7]
MRENADTNTEYSNPADGLTRARSCSGATARSETAAIDLQRIRFEVLRSALYHDRCEISLARRHKILTFLTVLGGSGAVVAFGIENKDWGQAAGIAIAAIGSLQLVWDYAGSARDHRELRKKFYTLLARVECDDRIDVINGDLILLYADEPPLRRRINRLAHNQAGRSIYGDGNFDVEFSILGKAWRVVRDWSRRRK